MKHDTTESNWFLRISYEGTNFHGWQRQPNSRTAQGELETAFKDLFGVDVLVDGCSRTDSGVHALDQCATVRPPKNPAIPIKGAVKALNGRLPRDIHICSGELRDASFHARSASVGKRYVFLLHRGNPGPFLHRWVWKQPPILDLDAMRQAASDMIGTHDFSPFTVSGGSPGQSPIKTIHRIDITEFGPIVAISYVGNAFLYKMVRRLTGLLRDIALHRLPPDMAGRLLVEPTLDPSFYTASASGLFLHRILYDPTQINDPPPSIESLIFGS